MNRLPFRGIVVSIVSAAIMSMIASPASASTATGDDPGNPVHQHNATLATTLFRAVFDGGDASAAETLIAPDAVIHTPYGEFTGPEGLQDYLDIVRRGYPDAWFDITAVNVAGDTVVVHWTLTATRYLTGTASSPVNVRVASPGETTITVADGQVAELHVGQQVTATASARNIAVAYGPTE